jgi:glycosyltransferase involved in cell wall biosynthesis
MPYPVHIILFTDRQPDGFQAYAAPNARYEVLGSTGGRFARLRWLFVSLPRALRREAVDVFYSSFYFLPPRLRGVRLINSIHDCAIFYVNPALNRGLLASPGYLRILKEVMQWTNRRSDATITVSRFSRDMIHRHLGRPVEAIKVCYHGLDADLPLGEVSPERGEGTAGEEAYFLFVGTNLPKKNLRQCLAGFAGLPPEIRARSKLKLKTNCYPENRKQIDELGIHERVEFIDRRLDETAMTALFRGARVVVLLSYDEGFGLPIIEAFAAGVPVLVSNRAACNELVSMDECKADPDDTAEITRKWLALTVDHDLRHCCLAEQARLLSQFSRRVAADNFFQALTS